VVYDTIGRIKGTRLKHDDIAEYVGDKNSNLDVSNIYRIDFFNDFIFCPLL
jgi:intein-encoded DNA endonuclease-like protein